MDDLLAEAIAPVLAPLAEGCFEAHQQEAARRAVEHIWENRRHAANPAWRCRARNCLAQFHSPDWCGLAARSPPDTGQAVLDPELIALQLATGQLAVLGAWMSVVRAIPRMRWPTRFMQADALPCWP